MFLIDFFAISSIIYLRILAIKFFSHLAPDLPRPAQNCSVGQNLSKLSKSGFDFDWSFFSVLIDKNGILGAIMGF